MYIYIHTHVYRLPRIILHDASRIKNKKGNAVYKDSIVDVSMQKAESPGRNAQIGRDVDWSVTQITRIVAIGAGNALARIERLAKGVMEFRKLKNDHASLKHPSLVSPCFQLATCSCNSWYQTSYVIHIEEGGGGGEGCSRLCLHNAESIPGVQPTVPVHDNRHTEFSQNGVVW